MIRVLSKEISNKIAAGEVVDRPLSIVKELTENAVDAGAGTITVEIKNGGKSYIRITDDGCGIHGSEVETAFLRHATSKIATEEDLSSINTLGFRGEALSSIAAVSKVELITKTSDESAGTKLVIHGGEVFDKAPTGCPEGTTIVVTDLFYNTPARLKFLKTDATESTLIIDFVSKLAICYTDIKVRLINNGTVLFSTTGKGDRGQAIATVYNKDISSNLLSLLMKGPDMELEAYISKPDYSRTNRRQQIFYVNGRLIQNKTLDAAVSMGYKERLFEGRYPVVYLFLRISPDKVDVNIHPNKKEVKFHDDALVKDFVCQAITRRLLSEESMPEIKQEQKKTSQLIKSMAETKAQIREEAKSQEQVNVKSLLSSIASSEAESHEATFAKEAEADYAPAIKAVSEASPDAKVDAKPVAATSSEAITYSKPEAEATVTIAAPEPVPTSSEFADLVFNSIIFDTYIACTKDDTFYLIDQHAAHERVFYEKLMKQYENGEKFHQEILTPMVVEVPFTLKSTESSWCHILSDMGFTIEPFGNKSYVVKAIPAFMELSEAENLLNYFLENVREDVDIKNQSKIDKLITRSCKAAVKAHDKLSYEECKALLNQLSKCRNPYSCPHGRPTFIKLTKYQLEKMFKRVQ